MSGIIGVLHDLYIRFLIWLGAEPPTGYEHLISIKARPQEYTLKEGDTIFAVARQFGVHYDLIAQANGLEDYESIQPGKTLTIPAPDWTPDTGPVSEPEAPAEAASILEVTTSAAPARPEKSLEASPAAVLAPDLDEEAEPAVEAQEAFEVQPEVDRTPSVRDEPPSEVAEAQPEEPEPATEPESISNEALKATPLAEELFRYTVQRGDTLSAIARRYGLTVKDLVEANDLADSSRIFPDQKLTIPGYMLPKPAPGPESQLPPPPTETGEHFIYTIVGGDTLSAISKRYGITLRELIEANSIEDPNLIRAGQKLVIPGVAKPSGTTSKPEPILEPESIAEFQTPPQHAGEPSSLLEGIPEFSPLGAPSAVRALYVSYFAIGHAEYRQRIFELLDTTELNAVVIDAKGDFGWISYRTQIPLAHEIGAARPAAQDFDTILAQFKERGIYTIARIVTFKDNLLAKSHPELAVKTDKGSVWQDRDGLGWSDPFAKPVWDYNIQIGIEAARMGFDEIQFDYIRFPTPSQAGTPHFSQGITRETRVTTITGFLSAARGQLKPLGVKLAADIFGYTCWREDDAVIGQDIERMGQYLDVMCPMLYPSTFGNGIPGYKFAIAHPYEIVYHSAIRAVNRLKPLGCNVRPWIQDFPDYRFDKRVYGKEEIQAQIKGCFDSGSTGFMVWDPRVQYTDGAYAPVRELA